MNSLEADLERARELDVAAIADAVESIGFECTRCGGCCTAEESDAGREPHTATVFPDEVRRLQAIGDREWDAVARPMPYGIEDAGPSGGTRDSSGGTRDPSGETFEWALAVDGCGDCVFYTEDEDGVGACTVHEARPLVCRTYPFSLDVLSDREEEAAVERDGAVLAHECAGLGRDISRTDAEAMAETLKRRAIRELEEAIAVRDSYRPTAVDGVVVHDSEGQKRPDGTPLGDGSGSDGPR